jgi:hypothetical protein
MRSLLLALVTWIAAHSGYPVPDTLPDVVAMTQADFELYLCEQMEQCDTPMPHAAILALFDFDSRTIYIRQGFDPGDREHQSTMVRQLVHFLQAVAGRSRACRGLLVQEARQIENRWRAAHDVPPLPVTPLGMLLESCLPGPT